MSLSALIVPSYSQMISALSAWLDKASAHVEDSDRLLAQSLAPDMLPLAAQVRFCCAQAEEVVSRLQGQPLSEKWHALIEEGHKSQETAGSMAQAQSYLMETLEFLKSLQPDCVDEGKDLPISIELPNGMIFDMSGDEYVRDWAMPQFYFHLMTAYAILRNAGVLLGKADYVSHAFSYLRPGTMPNG